MLGHGLSKVGSAGLGQQGSIDRHPASIDGDRHQVAQRAQPDAGYADDREIADNPDRRDPVRKQVQRGKAGGWKHVQWTKEEKLQSQSLLPLGFVSATQVSLPACGAGRGSRRVADMADAKPATIEYVFTTRPELRGTFGMVSSTHWIASQTAMAVLERGGNAFDAAVAAGFVLQVVEPHLNGPGGDLPIILWDARRAAVEVICGQGPAPKAATTSHFRSLGLDDIPGTGLLAACVPGAFGGWLRLLADHGSMRLRDVLQPAIDYAGSGYPLVEAISEAIAQVEELFRDEWHESARVYLDRGVPRPHTTFRNPDLAQTYERVVNEAERAGSDRDRQIDAALQAF